MAARLRSISTSIAGWHGDERTVGSPLNDAELIALRRTRLFGATGTVLMAIGALGAGARPVVQDPTFGVRLLNLPSRIQTVSLTMTTTGAVMMALAWLMLGRFALGSRRMTRSQLDRTLLLWALPLLIAPPMYSKDVYSYLAQSEISLQGLDPYRVGPAPGLGLGHVFTLSVPSLWRDTPAPYGPLFLWIGRSISALTGENIVEAVLFHRLVVLVGVGLIVWATPRLARRCGVAEVSALWLGPANPLLFMHLVAGIHNEALMLGLMLAGTEFALRGIGAAQAATSNTGAARSATSNTGAARSATSNTAAARSATSNTAAARSATSNTGAAQAATSNTAAAPFIPRPLAWPRGRDEWARWQPMGMLLLGTVLITMSSQVKLPSLLALGFVAMALACRLGATFKAFLIASTSLTAVSLTVMAVIGWASGLGFGWIYTLGTANVVRSWMSPPTLLALGTGQVGILLGLGDHTTAVLALTRGIGVFLIAVVVTWLLMAVLRGRLHPVGGLGVALGATVLLFPVVQPWYLLWAIIPLACWATRPRFRVAVIVVTLVIGIFGPTANGDRFALFQIVLATAASAVIVLILIALTYYRLPGRKLPDPGEAQAPPPEVVEPTLPAPQTAKPGAYAESP
ncbi:polyprenol phosphomannose-dependent alpha 1,6 mannosyltransferase MptB [Mycobacterium sp.]|uniref:polyprenol phosphomannose-dependent alpha 1,6 mannosyltransferase MptB n=1 Tax=Mycobacterium sp. TaxID=1785 RepID=UPI00333EC86F